MIPLPGETPGAWWDNTGSLEAHEAAAQHGGYGAEFDPAIYFLHDVPPEVAADGERHQRPETDAAFGSVCSFAEWPSIPIRVVIGADDRFFPVEFQRTLARDRLGVEADVLPGGHLIALARPLGLAESAQRLIQPSSLARFAGCVKPLNRHCRPIAHRHVVTESLFVGASVRSRPCLR